MGWVNPSRTPRVLGLPILEISKTQMHEFWFDYIKPKFQEIAKVCYMDTSFIIHIKTVIFMKTLPIMFKKDFTYQIIKSIGHCIQERIKKWFD